jgi:type I restriction enzyme S subunit
MAVNRIDIGTFTIPISIKCGISNAEKVYGIDINKQFIETKANMAEIDTSRYNVVPSNCFAANFMHIGRDEIIPVAFNDTENDLIVSPAYFIFRVEESIVLSEYFYMVLSSNEFDRYAWFCTDSSVRGNLDWDRFCEIEIDLPPVNIQKKYADVYSAITKNAIFRTKIKNICPVLIKGSLEESLMFLENKVGKKCQ